MPGKLTPGTPSMSGGTRSPCQWIELVSVNWLVTRIVAVSPSRNRNTGPGSKPLTTVGVALCPSISSLPLAITRLASGPELSSMGAALAEAAHA